MSHFRSNFIRGNLSRRAHDPAFVNRLANRSKIEPEMQQVRSRLADYIRGNITATELKNIKPARRRWPIIPVPAPINDGAIKRPVNHRTGNVQIRDQQHSAEWRHRSTESRYSNSLAAGGSDAAAANDQNCNQRPHQDEQPPRFAQDDGNSHDRASKRASVTNASVIKYGSVIRSDRRRRGVIRPQRSKREKKPPVKRAANRPNRHVPHDITDRLNGIAATVEGGTILATTDDVISCSTCNQRNAHEGTSCSTCKERNTYDVLSCTTCKERNDRINHYHSATENDLRTGSDDEQTVLTPVTVLSNNRTHPDDRTILTTKTATTADPADSRCSCINCANNEPAENGIRSLAQTMTSTVHPNPVPNDERDWPAVDRMLTDSCKSCFHSATETINESSRSRRPPKTRALSPNSCRTFDRNVINERVYNDNDAFPNLPPVEAKAVVDNNIAMTDSRHIEQRYGDKEKTRFKAPNYRRADGTFSNSDLNSNNDDDSSVIVSSGSISNDNNNNSNIYNDNYNYNNNDKNETEDNSAQAMRFITEDKGALLNGRYHVGNGTEGNSMRATRFPTEKTGFFGDVAKNEPVDNDSVELAAADEKDLKGCGDRIDGSFELSRKRLVVISKLKEINIDDQSFFMIPKNRLRDTGIEIGNFICPPNIAGQSLVSTDKDVQQQQTELQKNSPPTIREKLIEADPVDSVNRYELTVRESLKRAAFNVDRKRTSDCDANEKSSLNDVMICSKTKDDLNRKFDSIHRHVQSIPNLKRYWTIEDGSLFGVLLFRPAPKHRSASSMVNQGGVYIYRKIAENQVVDDNSRQRDRRRRRRHRRHLHRHDFSDSVGYYEQQRPENNLKLLKGLKRRYRRNVRSPDQIVKILRGINERHTVDAAENALPKRSVISKPGAIAAVKEFIPENKRAVVAEINESKVSRKKSNLVEDEEVHFSYGSEMNIYDTLSGMLQQIQSS